jgi:hypothetical protein
VHGAVANDWHIVVKLLITHPDVQSDVNAMDNVSINIYVCIYICRYACMYMETLILLFLGNICIITDRIHPTTLRSDLGPTWYGRYVAKSWG